MDLSILKTPEILLQYGILAVFGQGAVFAAFVFANWILSWYDFGKRVSSAARVASGAGRIATDAIRTSRRGQLIIAVIPMMTLLAAQLGWVGLAFYYGCFLNFAINYSGSPGSTPSVAEISSWIDWNPISQWAVVVQIGIVVLAYTKFRAILYLPILLAFVYALILALSGTIAYFDYCRDDRLICTPGRVAFFFMPAVVMVAYGASGLYMIAAMGRMAAAWVRLGRVP